MATGTIKWFTPEKRFGFAIADDDGRTLFVHHKFVTIPNFEYFNEGDRIEYETVEGPKGLEARNVRMKTEVKSPPVIKFGFSECIYNPDNKKLVARGWFLGPEIEKIEVYLNKNTFLGQAKTGMWRSDVLKNYPEYNEPNSGWCLEKYLDKPIEENMEVSVNIFSAGSIIQKIIKKVTVYDLYQVAKKVLK